jgi:hypothetical protein
LFYLSSYEALHLSNFVIACPAHAPLFQHETSDEWRLRPAAITEKLHIRKRNAASLAGARTKAPRRGLDDCQISKHITAAHEILKGISGAAVGDDSDGEDTFLAKERFQEEANRARMKPMVLRPPGPHNVQAPEGSASCSNCPDTLATSWEFNAGFQAVGGLEHVLRSLKEMVLLPLAYPQLFEHLKFTPPR